MQIKEMQIKDMIYCRKSVRSYTGEAVGEETLQKIREFAASARPLFPEIQTRCEIVSRNQVKTIMPWATPQLIAVFSEKKDGYLENAGFVFQQLELYLNSIGLGACWMGLGKLSRNAVEAPEGFEFVILMAFGHPKGEARRELSEFRRLTLAEIADTADERLEPARLAPSSVNSQPWYFTHEGGRINVYCVRKGIIKMLTDMNRIDMGIALAHIYVCNPDTFAFERARNQKEIKGYACLGSFTLE